MRAKQLFYTCAALCLLAGAYTVGARIAKADFEPDNGSHIIGASSSTGIYEALRSDGTVWRWQNGQWSHLTWIPPMPTSLLSEVVFYGGTIVITRDGYLWEGSDYGWQRRDQIPSPAVAADVKTWSGVKQDYRR